MTVLARMENTIFVGQAVEYPGTSMHRTLSAVPDPKRLEMPVEEDFQLGFCLGLAAGGMLPVSIFPRWNFLLLASNQLVNHINPYKTMTRGSKAPVIIRTSVGSQRPLHPGPQHSGDFTEAFKLLLPDVDVVRLDEPEQIVPAYMNAALRSDGTSTLLVEWGDFYHEK